MRLRKVINLSGVLGVTLPKELCNAVDVEYGDYFEVYLGENKAIVMKKHHIDSPALQTSDSNIAKDQLTIYDK